MTRKDWLTLFGLSLPWGCSFLFFRVLGTELPPLTIALGRVGIAAVVLAAVLAAFGHSVIAVRTHWRGLLALALLNNAVPFTLFAYGEKTVPSGTAAILNALTPILTVLVLRVVEGAPLSWNKGAGALLAFAGVIVLVGIGNDASPSGVLACLLAALSYACSAPFMTGLRKLPPMLVASGQLIASTLLLLPPALIVDRPWTLAAPSGGAWAALLGLALFSTAFAYLLYFRLVSSAGPANAMLVTYVIPVTAVLLGNLVLSEPITTRAVLGMAVILSGLALLDGRWLGKRARAA